MQIRRRLASAFVIVLGVVLLHTRSASAQTWNIDARVVGLGGLGGEQNIFTSGLADARGEHSFALPFGLLRLLQERQRFDPRSTGFNPLELLAFTANPMHVPVAGGTSAAASLFASDVRNGTVSRDLNAYRGFTPQAFEAARLIAPRWGHTFTIGSRRPDARVSHHVYVGAGPNLALRTALAMNGPFTDLLYATGPRYERNSRLTLANQTTGQIALAITGGYRGAYRLAGDMELHVMLNLNGLRGLRYEGADVALAFQTDASGLVGSSTAAAPLSILRRTSTHGAGRSADAGIGFVRGRWEAGISGQNIANRMTWRDAARRTYTMTNVTGRSAQFTITAPIPLGAFTDALPEAYRANLGYRSGRTSLQAEAGREGNRKALRAGAEYSFARLAVRGAASWLNDAWQPSAGLSLPLGRGLWADAAFFSTTANIERRRQYTLATSLRLAR